MTKHKIPNKFKILIPNTKTNVLLFGICALCLFCHLNFGICHLACAQETEDLKFTLDATSNTIPLPKVFRPNIDLSGRGFHKDASWPQALAAKEALDIWQKDMGFSGFYRLQYNLWEINQLSKDKDAQDKLLANYESVIKSISDAGAVVILDIFGTPAGLGKVLDKKSPPWDLKAFKELVKNVIRDYSCSKRYNIWYEVWNAPDLDDFFLGRKQDYLNLYRAVAEAIKELELETKVHIPLGGPDISWWFQNLEGNTILTPERSLIYELIKFCYRYRLSLDFISWHAFSTAPAAEKEITLYRKTAINLIRDWLSYFNFSRDTPLIVDEWNYDRNANLLPERQEKSFIAASYIPARLKNMYDAGVDNQIYFSLEDFQSNKEGLVRNVGVFAFEPGHSEYKGVPKAIYNAFRMLALLGKDMFTCSLQDDFTGAICSKTEGGLVLLIYNYIDPEIATNYLSANIALFSSAERKIILELIRSDRIRKLIESPADIQGLRSSAKVKALLRNASMLQEKAAKFSLKNRDIKIELKNLKGSYLYRRYTLDSSCSANCAFSAQEEKELKIEDKPYQETLTLAPYSLNLLILKVKPEEPAKSVAPVEPEQKAQEKK